MKMMIVEPAHVTPQLFFDFVSGIVKRLMGIARFSIGLQGQALHHMSHNIAFELGMGGFADGDIR